MLNYMFFDFQLSHVSLKAQIVLGKTSPVLIPQVPVKTVDYQEGILFINKCSMSSFNIISRFCDFK